jgi:hypothetical protein
MPSTSTSSTPAELAQEVSTWAVGGGLVTVALFPLALPLILLTLAAAIPLLLLGLVAALVAAPIFLLRRMWRSIGASRRPESGEARAARDERQALTWQRSHA